MKIERKMYNFKDIPLHHPHPPPQKNDRRITIRSSGEKCIERVVTVALPSCQCRVSAHNSLTNTTLPTTQPKMATAIFGFGLAHAPEKPQGLDRKNTIAGKVRGKAGTANNKRFCMMAALPRVDNIDTNCLVTLILSKNLFQRHPNPNIPHNPRNRHINHRSVKIFAKGLVCRNNRIFLPVIQ